MSDVATTALARAAVPGALWIIDLDGVVWLAGEPIGAVGEAVAGLRERGVRVAFATNNSAPTSAELLARLARAGIDAEAGDLVTSADAAASLVAPGDSAFVLAADGVLEALAARGVTVRDGGPVDAVVVGWTRGFDFDRLAAAATEVRRGARLVGTNDDPTHPTPDGLLPGSGAILAAVATASGATPTIAGKPHDPMVALIRSRFRLDPGGPPVVMVGDQPRTDGRLAARVGALFALVDSGVTPPGSTVDGTTVDARAADLVSLVRTVVDGA